MSRLFDRTLGSWRAPTPACTVRWIAVSLALGLVAVAVATAQRGRTSWSGEVVLEAPSGLCGCAIGELRPDRRGREIVAVATDGTVHVASRPRGRWKSEPVYRAPGALIQVAVGDVVAESDGAEIVAVGMAEGPERDDAPGVAVVLRRTGGGWEAETAFRSPALVHGVCVLEGQVFVTGYDRGVHRLHREAGTWRAERVATLPGAGKTVAAVAGGVAVACTNGSVVRIEPDGARWRLREIDRRPSGRARLATDGSRIVVGDDDGTVSLLAPPASDAETAWAAEVVFRDEGKSRGAVLADLVPRRPGLEVATGGYSKRVTLLRERGGRWRATTIFEDTAKLHHLVAGELDGRPGADLVACGYSGRLIVLRRARPALPGPQAGDWRTDVAVDLGIGIGGCAVGDLIAERAGDEIAAVAKDGSIHLVLHTGTGWSATTVHRAAGELIQVAIGDADPRSPGNEIIAVGVAAGAERSEALGAAVIVRRTTEGWRGERVFTAKALLHGACAFGGAAFVTGYDEAVHRLRFSGGAWRADRVAALPGPGKQALATPAGIVLACRDGTLARLEPAGDTFRLVRLDRRPSGRARLGTDGERIVVSDDDGTLSIVSPPPRANGRSAEGGAWRREAIYREFDLQRGAILADLEPETPGLEAATAGYEAKITLLTRAAGRWWARMLYRDADRLHHLAAGDVDGRPGLELVACGYSGRLLVLRRETGSDAPPRHSTLRR